MFERIRVLAGGVVTNEQAWDDLLHLAKRRRSERLSPTAAPRPKNSRPRGSVALVSASFIPAVSCVGMEYATALFSTASSLVARSALSSSYTLASHAQGPNAHPPAPIQIGVWRVERATHNSNGKVVSIWTCDRSHLASGGSGGGARAASGSARRLEKTIEVLRKEVSHNSQLSLCRGPESSRKDTRRRQRTPIEACRGRAGTQARGVRSGDTGRGRGKME